MLALLRNLTGSPGSNAEEAKEKVAAEDPVPRLVPQLALEKIGTQERERQNSPLTREKKSRQNIEEESSSSRNTEAGGIHASLKVAALGEPLVVDKVWPGGPAAKSKMISTGDLLLEVNGRDVSGKSVRQAQELIIGPVGSTVTLTVQQSGKKYPHKVSMTREPRDLSRGVSSAKSPHKARPSGMENKKKELEQTKADLRRSSEVLSLSPRPKNPQHSPRPNQSAGSSTLQAVPHEGDNLLGGGEDFNSDVAPPPAASRTQTQKEKDSAQSIAAPREGDELLGRDTPGALRTPKRKKKVTEQPKASKARSEHETPLAKPEKTPANPDLEQLALAVPLPSTRKATPRSNSARTHPVGGVPSSNVNGDSASEAPPTGDDDVARRVLLEGQVRRLKEQLEAKSKAHTSALAQVEDLEARSDKLRTRLRVLEAHVRSEPVASPELSESEGQHTDKSLAAPAALQETLLELSVQRAAAQSSRREAVRERAAREAAEKELHELVATPAPQVPVVLRARLAELEVEFAQECRRRVAAEAALESMMAAMASEMEQMTASRANAVARARASQARVQLQLRRCECEEARRAHAEYLLANILQSAAGTPRDMLMSSSAENTFSFYTAMNQELQRTREALVAAGAEKDWQRRECEAVSAAAAEEAAELRANIKHLEASAQDAEEHLRRAQREVETEAIGRFRAEATLGSIRAALLRESAAERGAASLAAVDQERLLLQAQLEGALAEARQEAYARLELEERLRKLEAEALSKSALLVERVMVLEAEVAGQQGREQEAIRRERALLAKDAADVARAQAAEEEVVARIAEAVDDVRAEEKERQQAMKEELEELRRLVTALPTPKGASAFENLPRHTQTEDWALAPRGRERSAPNTPGSSTLLTLTLELPFAAAGDEHSRERLVFGDELAKDLADASGLAPACFRLVRLLPGSIVVDVEITAEQSERVARDLQAQAIDPQSALRAGALTSFTRACFTHLGMHTPHTHTHTHPRRRREGSERANSSEASSSYRGEGETSESEGGGEARTRGCEFARVRGRDELEDQVEQLQDQLRRVKADLDVAREREREREIEHVRSVAESTTQEVSQQQLLEAAQQDKQALAQQVKKLAARLVEETRQRALAQQEHEELSIAHAQQRAKAAEAAALASEGVVAARADAAEQLRANESLREEIRSLEVARERATKEAEAAREAAEALQREVGALADAEEELRERVLSKEALIVAHAADLERASHRHFKGGRTAALEEVAAVLREAEVVLNARVLGVELAVGGLQRAVERAGERAGEARVRAEARAETSERVIAELREELAGADARNLALSDAMQEDVDMHTRLVESHSSLSDETANLRQRVRELEAACHSHEKLHLEDLQARDMTKKLGEANAKLTEALTEANAALESTLRSHTAQPPRSDTQTETDARTRLHSPAQARGGREATAEEEALKLQVQALTEQNKILNCLLKVADANFALANERGRQPKEEREASLQEEDPGSDAKRDKLEAARVNKGLDLGEWVVANQKINQMKNAPRAAGRVAGEAALTATTEMKERESKAEIERLRDALTKAKQEALVLREALEAAGGIQEISAAELSTLNQFQAKLLSGHRGDKEVLMQLQQLLAVKSRGEAAKDLRMKHALDDRDKAMKRAERAEALLRIAEPRLYSGTEFKCVDKKHLAQ